MAKSNIIGRPPKRRGAVFGDVPVGGLFLHDGEAWLKTSRDEARLMTVHGPYNSFGENTPVTLLTVTPAEPETDPDLVTYVELEQGAFFRFKTCTLGGRTWLRTSPGFVGLDGRPGDWTAARDYDEVDNLHPTEVAAHILADTAASVVVHGEGRAVRRRSPFGTWDICERDGTRVIVDRAELEAIVQQGAAALASFPDEPAESPFWKRAREAAAEVAEWPEWKRRAADTALYSPVEPAKTTPPCVCDGKGDDDRCSVCKPAPGWTVTPRGGSYEYRHEGQALAGVARTEAEAIARTWSREQARKAGER